jgi:Na+/proline symporter
VILESTIYGWEFNPNAPGIFGAIGAVLNGVPVFFVNFFVTLAIIVIVSLVTKPPEDVVELHQTVFKKVPVNVIEARSKSQVEHVAEFLSKNKIF